MKVTEAVQRLQTPSNLGPVGLVALAEALAEVALLGEHRDQVHGQQREQGEEHDPEVVGRQAEADGDERHPQVHRVAGEAVGALEEEFRRWLPRSGVLPRTGEMPLGPGDQAQAGRQQEQAAEAADHPGDGDRGRRDEALAGDPEEDAGQEDQRRGDADAGARLVRLGWIHGVSSSSGR
jgi:hypothetical protein